jgi:hypothetical protein
MDCPVSAVVEERPFLLRDTVNFVLGPDETLQGRWPRCAGPCARTRAEYWRDWGARALDSVPVAGGDHPRRDHLHLAVYQDTGAIVAPVTTSAPEATTGGRTWDYRFCCCATPSSS